MKKNKKNNLDNNTVKAVNKSIRSSIRKLSPILKSIVGKKAEVAIRNLSFSEKRISKDIKKTMQKIAINTILINYL
jgi:large subunit ribosomal protein L22